jgi:hypothetical protein
VLTNLELLLLAHLHGPQEPALALEEVIEEDPGFAGRLAAMLEDLSQHPPPGSLAVRDAGPSLEPTLSLRPDGTPPGATLTRTQP